MGLVQMALNKREQEVQQANLDAEKLLLKQLQACYRKAQSDCVARIQELAGRTDMENIQAIVFQVQYQQAIKKQIDSILDTLQTTQFSSVADYLTTSYENGWVGAFYDLQGQGIPLIFPVNQEQVVQAIQNDAKLSKSYYDRLGEDVAFLKKAVKAQVSRGIANGSSWFQVAQELHNKMTNPFGNALYNAMRIARTEGHRVQQQSQWNAINEAKKAGCDIVKQWDSTLDGRTRSTHARLDGQIREIDEPFEVDGKKAMYPGAFGRPEEDIHCRCCCAQRAKWALDEDELRILEERAKFFGLDNTENFEQFKTQYLQIAPNADKITVTDALTTPVTSSTDPNMNGLLSTLEQRKTIAYNPVQNNTTLLSDEEIISTLAGGDRTKGSCASVALAYIGQKQGWNVHDFRDGASREFFSSSLNLRALSKVAGIKTLTADGACALTVGNRLLKQCEVGREYYLSTGRHAAIVRKTEEGKLQYLELQSARFSGWRNFDGNPRATLHSRFGCSQVSDYGTSARVDFMIDIEASDFSTDDFKSLLGYLNTDESAQRKGEHGTIK